MLPCDRCGGVRLASFVGLPSEQRYFNIPFCRLPLAACRSRFTSNPDLAHVGRATLGQGIARVRHVIWDETSGRLIPFRELQNRLNAGPVDGAKPQTDAL
ncbi:MAG TPA: hypothetical protein VGJ20_13240 [Xanthobacteraceae bacterium]